MKPIDSKTATYAPRVYKIITMQCYHCFSSTKEQVSYFVMTDRPVSIFLQPFELCGYCLQKYIKYYKEAELSTPTALEASKLRDLTLNPDQPCYYDRRYR